MYHPAPLAGNTNGAEEFGEAVADALIEAVKGGAFSRCEGRVAAGLVPCD